MTTHELPGHCTLRFERLFVESAAFAFTAHLCVSVTTIYASLTAEPTLQALG